MKKLNLLIILSISFLTLSVKAQVTVEDATTLKLGSTSNSVYSGYMAKYGDATGVAFGWDTGTLIEAGNSESGGIYIDGDKVVIWSPGDENLVNFCDEDYMTGPGTTYHPAIKAYIDGDGYYYQVSDSTQKENILTITSSLAKIMQLRGVEYYHKIPSKNSTKDNNNDTKKPELKEKKSGFLAQEVEKTIPEAVATNKAGVKFVNYQAIIPFLVQAMKEQQTQIEQLKKDNESMKTDIEAIKLALKTGKLK